MPALIRKILLRTQERLHKALGAPTLPIVSSKPVFISDSKKMHWSIAVLSYVLGSALAQNSSSGYNTTAPNLGPDVLTADMISSMGNNTLFNRWRPTYHFISPAGWMNVSQPMTVKSTTSDKLQDPCGMMYDPTTETYHLQYQFHPNHVNWGNISWGCVNINTPIKLTLTPLVTPHPRTL